MDEGGVWGGWSCGCVRADGALLLAMTECHRCFERLAR